MVITLLLVALSLGLSNFAGAARTRIEVGVFGLFEALMPIVGLIGHRSVPRCSSPSESPSPPIYYEVPAEQ